MDALPLGLVYAVASFAVVSHHDILRERDDETCLHLEQVDTEGSLRGLGFLRELLRRIVDHYTAVERVTLFVDGLNTRARRLYEFIGFELFGTSRPNEQELYGVLKGGELHRLRSCCSLLRAAPSSVEFTSLGGGVGAVVLNEETLRNAHSDEAAARPSLALSLSSSVLNLCGRNLSERHLSERRLVLSPESCADEALELLSPRSKSAREPHPKVACIAALLSRAELARAEARFQMHVTTIPGFSNDAAVRAATLAWTAACIRADAERLQVAAVGVAVDVGRRRWRRTYSFFFLGPQGQLRAYVGHESSYPTRARAHMSRQGGARWTESHSNILVEADFK